MKKSIILIALFLLYVVGYSHTAFETRVWKTVSIPTGQSFISVPTSSAMSLVKDSTRYIIVNCNQDFPMMQDLKVNMTTVTATPSVEVSLSARKFSGDSWVQCGAVATWTSTAVKVDGDTAMRYRQYLIIFHASNNASQVSWPSTVELKVWYTNATIGVTSITDGTASFTGGALSGATTGDFSGAVTTAALTASGLITANNGLTLGASDNLVGSSTSSILMNTDKFTASGVTGNVAVGGTLGITGVTTATGAVALNGGFTTPLTNPVIWAKGGGVPTATSGVDATPANGDRFWVAVDIPYNCSLTGIAYLVGSVGGTDSVVVQLCNSAGVEVATSKRTGAEHGLLVGTAAQYQSCAFNVGVTPTAYAAVAGRYYAAIQFNGNTARYRAYGGTGAKYITGAATSDTWDTKANITPGTTFTTDVGPILMIY
jgi:hypothetical protein